MSAPTVVVENAAGAEDTAIAVDIGVSLSDTAGPGEEITEVIISGLPAGATLSVGTHNADGSWTLSPGQLEGLTVTPPANSDTDFSFTVAATTTDADGETATAGQALTVTVTGVADEPSVSVTDVAGVEDGAIPLNIQAAVTDTDGSESITSVVISGVPTGAELSAGTDNGNGIWTLEPGHLAGLTVTPPPDNAADFSLTVTATATEADGGDAATTIASFGVEVAAVADAPVVTVSSATGDVNTTVPLDLSSTVADADGSESITSVVISGVPAGAALSHGSDDGNGNWTTVDVADLSSLAVTPAPGNAADFTLSVTAVAIDVDPDTGAATTAQITLSFDVEVAGVAAEPIVTVTSASGLEDSAIPLDISVALPAEATGQKITEIAVSGVPAGVVLSAGADQGNGAWILGPGDLSGLTLTPPADSSDDIALSVTATAQIIDPDTGEVSSASASLSFGVEITGVADAPTVTVGDVAGLEGQAIPLDISVALADTDGSESITSVTISGVPAGAALSAGADNGNGSWTVDVADVEGLTLTPAPDSDADFSLTVTATATEADGGAAQTMDTFQVDVTGVADAPTVTVADVSGAEDTAIPFDITVALADTDGSKSITSVVISGVPAGASLSAGADDGNGNWTVDVADLEGLTVTPAPDSDSDFALTVTAVSTEADGDTAETIATFNVDVTGVADAPTVSVADVTGGEDTAVPLNIAVALADTDVSESIT